MVTNPSPQITMSGSAGLLATLNVSFPPIPSMKFGTPGAPVRTSDPLPPDWLFALPGALPSRFSTSECVFAPWFGTPSLATLSSETFTPLLPLQAATSLPLPPTMSSAPPPGFSPSSPSPPFRRSGVWAPLANSASFPASPLSVAPENGVFSPANGPPEPIEPPGPAEGFPDAWTIGS